MATRSLHLMILIAEDDPNDVLLLRRAMDRCNVAATVHFVHNGEEAINYLAGDGDFADRGIYPLPTLMLLDIKMPRRSGLDVLAWVRNQPTFRRTPVVILTSSQEAADIARAYELGANSYLVKPQDFTALVALVSAFNAYWLTQNQWPQ